MRPGEAPATTVPGDPAGAVDLLGDASPRRAEPPLGGDITYVMTFSGWVYTAFIMDLYSRRIVAGSR